MTAPCDAACMAAVIASAVMTHKSTHTAVANLNAITYKYNSEVIKRAVNTEGVLLPCPFASVSDPCHSPSHYQTQSLHCAWAYCQLDWVFPSDTVVAYRALQLPEVHSQTVQRERAQLVQLQ